MHHVSGRRATNGPDAIRGRSGVVGSPPRSGRSRLGCGLGRESRTTKTSRKSFVRGAIGPRLRLRVLRQGCGPLNVRRTLGLARVAGGDDLGGGSLARDARSGPRAAGNSHRPCDGGYQYGCTRHKGDSPIFADTKIGTVPASQSWRGGKRRILTSADRGSLDAFFARSDSLASNNSALTIPIEPGERHLSSSEFLQRIQRHPARPTTPSIVPFSEPSR